MWKDISQAWQLAFEEAWKSFCDGSTPIGAVLCDEDDNVILSDHNRNHEPGTINRRIAHAEANILKKLDTSKFETNTLTLYSTMEPCPMCMGTIVMSNIKKVRTAAADTYCGMAHLLETEPYYRAKSIDMIFEGGELEQVQLAIQAYYELRYVEKGHGMHVFDKFMEHCPTATEVAQRMYVEKWLDKAVDNKTVINDVYDHIVSEIQKK